MKHGFRARSLKRWLISVFLLLFVLACSPFVTPGSVQETAPALTAEEVAALVDAAVAEQLAQQAQRTPIAYPPLPAADTDLEATLIDVYARSNPAVVYIIVRSSGGIASGTGSGFVYSREGHIVTNSHVVTGGSAYEVVFSSGDRALATLVGADVDSDLAVLKVDALPEGLAPLPVVEEDSLQVGQFVIAIGNPFGEQGSMSLGIVSGLGRSLSSQRGAIGGSTYSLPQVIQTDAPINPGNSGGPLLNLKGEVVGVNAAIATTTGANTGVGFSIPAAAIRRIVPGLIADGRYVYPYMGVAFDGEITLEEQARYGLSQIQGAYVVNVTSGSPGAAAGLIAANPNTGQGGDLIIALDDWPVNSFNDLNTYLSFHASVGQTVAVKVLRGSETVTLSLTLGARP